MSANSRSPQSSTSQISIDLEEKLAAFTPEQIEAIVKLQCAQLQVLSAWQDQHASKFGVEWVDAIGHEADLWALSLELTGMLSDEQERRIREANATVWFDQKPSTP